MASRARRSHPRPPARRGGAVVSHALRLPPLINGFRAEIHAPVNGYSSNDRSQPVTVSGVSALATPVDFQVEWRRQQAVLSGGSTWLPDATYTVSVSGVPSGEQTPVVPPAELQYGTWWVRVRAGDATFSLWSDWSAQQWMDIRPVLGSMAQYIDLNVGVTDPPLAGAFAYIEMNVGVPEGEALDTISYLEMNVGVSLGRLVAVEYSEMNIGPMLDPYRASEYLDVNVVNDETPVPHIWWIRPEQGKEGYVFNIYGQGFGAFQNEYDGKVLLGNLVCSIARWDRVPPQVTATTVNVLGTLRTTTTTTAWPAVLLSASTVVIEAGDIIEYDVKWDSPGGSRLDIFPTFDISGTSVEMGYSPALLNDTTGDAWISDQPEAYGEWHHRRFVVPPGNYLIGKTLSNFSIAWYGFDPAQPVRGGSIRSLVIRSSDESVKLWPMGDDHQSIPPLTYTANGGALTSATFEQEGFVIDHGEGLDPDTITPEYGWIVAVVPSGAVSSMVRVVLEDD